MSDTQTAEQSTDALDDIRSAVASAFDAAQAPEPPQEVEDEAPSRARDASGRFTKAEEAPEPEAPPEPEEKPEPEAKPEVKPDDEFSKATSTWAASHREMLAKLPSEAQQFIVERHRQMEGDYTRKTQEIASFRRDYDPIRQMFEPHLDVLRSRGLTPATAVQAWHQAERTLMGGGEQAAHLIGQIVSGYKLDKGTIARALGLPSSTQAAADPADPQPQQAPPTLPPQVAQELHAMRSWIVNEQRTREQTAAATVMNDIDQFASATDASGKLLHPHFREVEDDMTRLASVAWGAGKRPVLSDLYQQAVWANPTTRDKLLADERAALEAQHVAAEQKRAQEARAKAEQARRAASSVTGTPGPGHAARRAPESLREQLEEAWNDRPDA